MKCQNQGPELSRVLGAGEEEAGGAEGVGPGEVGEVRGGHGEGIGDSKLKCCVISCSEIT